MQAPDDDSPLTAAEEAKLAPLVALRRLVIEHRAIAALDDALDAEDAAEAKVQGIEARAAAAAAAASAAGEDDVGAPGAAYALSEAQSAHDLASKAVDTAAAALAKASPGFFGVGVVAAEMPVGMALEELREQLLEQRRGKRGARVAGRLCLFRKKQLAEMRAFWDVLLRWLIEHGAEPKEKQGAAGDAVFCVHVGVAWTQKKLAKDLSNARQGFSSMDAKVKAYATLLLGEGWEMGKQARAREKKKEEKAREKAAEAKA